VIIQYLGFQARSWGRDYSYRVIAGTAEKREQRNFTVTINDRAFSEQRLPYQAAADLCYQKLQKVLALETPEQPLPLRLTLSDHDLDEYREKQRPAK
jgi:hypothetical protein